MKTTRSLEAELPGQVLERRPSRSVADNEEASQGMMPRHPRGRVEERLQVLLRTQRGQRAHHLVLVVESQLMPDTGVLDTHRLGVDTVVDDAHLAAPGVRAPPRCTGTWAWATPK